MNIRIRPLTQCDIQTFRTCYDNWEFKHFIYGDKSIDIDNSFNKLLDKTNDSIETYLVLLNNNGDSVYGVVGFCSFMIRAEYPIEVREETYAFSGGILPSLFNTGIGVFACASLLRLFFTKHPNSDLYASTFRDNTRSSKMLVALGFKHLEQRIYDQDHFLLNANHYLENDFVIRLMCHIQLDFEI